MPVTKENFRDISCYASRRSAYSSPPPLKQALFVCVDHANRSFLSSDVKCICPQIKKGPIKKEKEKEAASFRTTTNMAGSIFGFDVLWWIIIQSWAQEVKICSRCFVQLWYTNKQSMLKKKTKRKKNRKAATLRHHFGHISCGSPWTARAHAGPAEEGTEKGHIAAMLREEFNLLTANKMWYEC